MSNKALTWAFTQRGLRSTAKFVLVAMADCANEQGIFYGSLGYLGNATNQNRKTIIEALDHLEQHGYIVDTEKRTGRTGQVKVYQLEVNRPESGDLFSRESLTSTDPKTEPFVSEDDGNPIESTPANGTENGTVPKTEQSQKSQETVPFLPPNSTENGTRNQYKPNQTTDRHAHARDPVDNSPPPNLTHDPPIANVGEVTELLSKAGIPLSWLLKPEAIAAQRDIVAMQATAADIRTAVDKARATKGGAPFGVFYLRPIVSEIVARRNGYGTEDNRGGGNARRGAAVLAEWLAAPSEREQAEEEVD